MSFQITKIVLWLILPPAGILLIALAGAFVHRRHPKCGRALVVIALMLLYVLSLPLTMDLLMRPLESACPPLRELPSKAAAVVVLGNGVRDLSWVPADPAPTETAVERLVHGIELARKLRLPLVLSGGSGEVAESGVREADAMADLAVRLGFPRRDLIVENRSRNTLENAREVRSLITGETVVLVTSAYHMKRSVAMFRKAGFAVVPAPTAYRTATRPASATAAIPRSFAFSISSAALSEYLSLAWYTVTGAI